MGNDVMYLDYFNGMSNLSNVNTIRLYKLDKYDTSVFLCSAPFTESIAYSISHNYDVGAAGLLGNILKKFSEGRKEGNMLLGSGMAILNQLGDLTGFESIEALTKSDKYKSIMKESLKDGSKEVRMPWENSVVYKSSTNTITTPSIKFFIASSKSFYDYIKNISSYTIKTKGNRDEKNKSFSFCEELREAKQKVKTYRRTGETKSFESNGEIVKDSEGNKVQRDVYEEKYYDNFEFLNEETPVKGYLNYLLYHIGGNIYQGNRKIDSLLSLSFDNPTDDNQAAKMAEAMDNKGFDLRLPDQGTLWAAIGDRTNPIILKSLFPESINIVPSKYKTPDGDFLWAEISINLKWSKMIITENFKDTLFGGYTIENKSYQISGNHGY